MSETDDLEHGPDFQRRTYCVLATSSIALLVIGTLVFSALGDWSYVDSFYFSVVTASTVGFGDLTPDTDAAKLISVVYILFGISIIATSIGARFKHHTYKRARRSR